MRPVGLFFLGGLGLLGLILIAVVDGILPGGSACHIGGVGIGRFLLPCACTAVKVGIGSFLGLGLLRLSGCIFLHGRFFGAFLNRSVFGAFLRCIVIKVFKGIHTGSSSSFFWCYYNRDL